MKKIEKNVMAYLKSVLGLLAYTDWNFVKCGILPKILKIRAFQGKNLYFFPRFFLTLWGVEFIVYSLSV